jgi:hypothetical protein
MTDFAIIVDLPGRFRISHSLSEVAMVESVSFGVADPVLPLSSAVQGILAHLCEGDCHAFGDILEWCEARGDCCYAVICPECRMQFVIDDDEMDELKQWTLINGSLLVCGIRLDDR